MMKRMPSKATLLKKRVRKIQSRAKFTGVLYLLGTVALVALVACMPMLTGTCITAVGATDMPVLTFYQPIMDIFASGAETIALTATQITELIVVALFGIMLLVMAINVLRSIKKLGWLFKRRASYANGFTLFTTGDRVEEEVRENGLFVFFVRNLIQIVAVVAIAYFLLQESILAVKIEELLKWIVEDQKPIAEIDWLGFVPAGLELLAWLFLTVLVGHATADTEFNRDGVVGSGMKNFAIFSFFTALVLGAGVALPMLGVGVAEVATELNQNLLVSAAVALVAFLLDCIIKPRARDDSAYDDVDIDAYFQGGEQRYNNTII